MAAGTLQWQSVVAETEIIWSAMPKKVSLWPFRKKVS